MLWHRAATIKLIEDPVRLTNISDWVSHARFKRKLYRKPLQPLHFPANMAPRALGGFLKMFPSSNSGAMFSHFCASMISPIRPQLVLLNGDAPRLDVSFAEFIFIEVKNNVSQFKGLGFFNALLVGRMISTRRT